jgi:hypothetical protein
VTRPPLSGRSSHAVTRETLAGPRRTTTIEAVLIEILTFEGCPHAAAAVKLAQRVVDEAGAPAELRCVYVSVADTDDYRFLGSPTIRVEGRDVEPGADDRRDYAHSCRLYRTADGLRPLPEADWLRAALASTP